MLSFWCLPETAASLFALVAPALGALEANFLLLPQQSRIGQLRGTSPGLASEAVVEPCVDGAHRAEFAAMLSWDTLANEVQACQIYKMSFVLFCFSFMAWVSHHVNRQSFHGCCSIAFPRQLRAQPETGHRKAFGYCCSVAFPSVLQQKARFPILILGSSPRVTHSYVSNDSSLPQHGRAIMKFCILTLGIPSPRTVPWKQTGLVLQLPDYCSFASPSMLRNQNDS